LLDRSGRFLITAHAYGRRRLLRFGRCGLTEASRVLTGPSIEAN
jgi:hypothetical protein